MEFNLLHQDGDCNCLIGAAEDELGMYMKKIDGPELLDRDFISKWEKGKRPLDVGSCASVCSFKGTSVNLVKSPAEIVQEVEVYKKTLTIKPKGKSKYALFKLKNGSGVVKHTPTDHSKCHHDFYKCDTFQLEKIDLQEICPII